MAAYSISIFLPHGDPKGLRIARKSHWTGEVLMCPRNLYPDVVKVRKEFERTGAYILVGQAEDGSEGSHVYVGESDNVRTRIKDHNDVSKEFWRDLVMITKVDGSLHKADVRYLEERLVALARKSQLTIVHNIKEPAPPRPTEAHKADLDSFLVDVLAILQLLGVSAFSAELSPAAVPSSLTPPAQEIHNSPNTAMGEFFFSLGGATGSMTATADSYVLHAGDGVLLADKDSFHGTYKATRQKLLENHALVPIAEKSGYLRLVADLSLRSPSAAGAVLYGGQVNGRTSWKDKHGKTFAERETDAVNDVQ
ncbi:MAG: GIY-YIG nuclease family protein [Actinomycetota bacterium]|nr:GIY-YIG nuclease family protein [Actinomycetota bacterium]